MEKFRNKYRIPSARLPGYDYGQNGAYFITICTKSRMHFFGEIVDVDVQTSKSDNVETPESGVSTVMALNEIGQLAQKYWMEIPNHFPFIELANFVVMPNHFHGILIINHQLPVETPKPDNVETPNLGVSTMDATIISELAVQTSKSDNVQTPKLGVSTTPIGIVINQYKRMVTIHARKIDADFAWQPRFYDHIVRNVQSFDNIQNYIANNPQNWKEDKFHSLLVAQKQQNNRRQTTKM
jgi:REP element-mobilizing transposase RayT